MLIVQLADGMLSIGGVSRFIYDLSVKLTERNHQSITAVYELEENNKWGNESLQIIKLEDNHNTNLKKVAAYNPDLIVWHVCGKTSAFARELSKKYPVLAIVHSIPCPSGTRLYRDKDEVCDIASGTRCLQNWYIRRCGTSPSPTKAIKYLRLHKSMMNTLKWCNWVCTISKSMKLYLMKEGIEENRITIFDVTLGMLTIPEKATVVARNKGEPVHVLYVGRLSYVKGVQYLIQAVKMMADEGVSIKCTIIGDGWFRDKLTQLSRELGLEEVVTFVGSVPGSEVGKWYQASDVFVAPSIYPEPAGLVVPEARSYGKPVVVFNVGGIAEWGDYMTGITLAKPADPHDLARAIKQSLMNEGDTAVANPYEMERINLVELIGNLLRPKAIQGRNYV